MLSNARMGEGMVSGGLQFTTGIKCDDRTIEDSLKELESLVLLSTQVSNMGNITDQVEFKTSLLPNEQQDLNVVRQKLNHNKQFDLSTFDPSIDYKTSVDPYWDTADTRFGNFNSTPYHNDNSTPSNNDNITLDSNLVPRSFNNATFTGTTLPYSLLSSLGMQSLNSTQEPETPGYSNNCSNEKNIYSMSVNSPPSMYNMNYNFKKQTKSSAIIPTWINIPENSKFFIIKCNNVEHIKKSFYNSIWSSTHFGNKRLSESYKRLDLNTKAKLFLFFSVNGSGKFCGVAEMTSDLRDDLDTSIWTESEKFGNAFKVRWIIVRNINNKLLKRFLLPNNEMKPVTNSRDTQEVPPLIGTVMLKLFKSQGFDFEITSFLDET